MRFGIQFLVKMMLIKYLITFKTLSYGFYIQAFLKRKKKVKKERLYLDVKRYRDIHNPKKGTIF